VNDLRYPVPAAVHRIEQVVDRSRFICTLARASTAEEAQVFIKSMNAEFPNATHNCWAYVLGPPGSTDRIGMSDDGEPHGTAGRPMLTVLMHCGIGEIVAVVTRYYGGTNLGTGGLVKAYGGAVQEALVQLPTQLRVDAVTVTFAVGYAAIGAVQQMLPTVEAEVVAQQFTVEAEFTVMVPRVQLPILEAQLQHITRGAMAPLQSPA
jgi:uncharacterized YigZ family protein